MMKKLPVVLGILLCALLSISSDCPTVNDTVPPVVHFIQPADGDTFDPGVYELRAIAYDDVAMKSVVFWADSEMLAYVTRASGDTYSAVVDCRADTHRVYPLTANAVDRAHNQSFDLIRVFVRR